MASISQIHFLLRRDSDTSKNSFDACTIVEAEDILKFEEEKVCKHIFACSKLAFDLNWIGALGTWKLTILNYESVFINC